MKMKLIPRVRVNYSFFDLICSLFVSERGQKHRNLLKEIISSIFKTNNILLTSSGRASIYLILRSLPQHKVVVPAYTCAVVVEAIKLAGKEVVYARTSSETFNITELPIIDNDTIVLATHQYGLACDIERIVEECHVNGALVIEDCAAALGTRINGKLAGLFGDYGIFSFDSSKMINVPSKGGFIISQNHDLNIIKEGVSLKPSSLLYKLRHLCRGFVYCLIKPQWVYRLFHMIMLGEKQQLESHDSEVIELGEFYTHGLYEWQAYIANKQMRHLDDIIKKRQYIYSYYDKYINNPIIQKPPFQIGAACIRYAILVNDKDSFYHKSLKEGVDYGFSFNHITTPTSFEEEHSIVERVLNVPFYYDLSKSEMQKVVDVINSVK